MVAAWRRSRLTGGEFAALRGLPEGTLRWWAWRLEREVARKPLAGAERVVSMVPVRVVADRDRRADDAVGGPAWTLRTARGELHVYAAGSPDALRDAIAMLLERES